MANKTVGIDIVIHDHSKEVMAALKNAIERGVFAIGEEAVSNAQSYVIKEDRIDTGNMRRSISHNEQTGAENFTVVGTDVFYAIYQEMGKSRGIKPAYFLTRAARNHTDRYKQILKDSIANA